VLILVYGVFLCIVAVTAVMQSVLISAHFTTSVVGTAASTDAGVMTAFANEQLSLEDFQGAPPDAVRSAAIRDAIRTFISTRGIVRAEVRTTDGVVIASDAPVVGMRVPPSGMVAEAQDLGRAAVSLVEQGADPEAAPGDLPQVPLLREVFPLVQDGVVRGSILIWRDATPIIAELDGVRRDIMVVTFSAAIIAGVILTLVYRSAQSRISRQASALLEAARRDPLTGLLSHGALVADLTAAMERLRGSPDPRLAVALVDIDNFRLLNDTHGHAAGDRAIATVLETLRAHVDPRAEIGRYGPDELMIVIEGDGSESLEATLWAFRTALASVAFMVGGGDPIPLTVSGAICAYPEHGSSLTELLATAAITLHEARMGGGDAIRKPRRAEDAGRTRSFDVFHGLVIAVDTKDRYTKRHSEDVARYALFLGQQLGLPFEELESLRIAGLLHDVGKIGIPDTILRKPGRLTLEEYEIVKQHVALGDMIVRDLPDIDAVRAGIRHHHERVDGRGYLHGLAGDDIPLIARILAVGDSFSAMTTTRPYRRALDVTEALRRLEDGAGWQLDERLVATFIKGIETVPGAPLPGDDPGRMWRPIRRVA
jgi:diguanylate cyclase (GGDEF)-like protein